MKLLYVIDSLGQGGAEQSLVAMAPHLVQEGVDLTVALLRDVESTNRADLLSAGACVEEVAGTSRMSRLGDLRRLLRRIQPDLVHTTLFEANQLGRTAAFSRRVPVTSSLVNTPFGPDHFAEPGLSAARIRAARAVDAMTARMTPRLHANAAHVADTMASRLRYPRRRIDVIPRGRDARELGTRTDARVRSVRASLDVLDDDLLLLCLARHEHQKGLDTAISALQAIQTRLDRRVRLLIAGRDGSASARLRRQVAEAELQHGVEFLGHRNDVGDLLAASDVLVLPSRREGFPGVIVEAMALEVPVVASDLDGVREALGEGNGMYVAVDDVEGLVRGVVRTVSDPVGTSARVAAGRRRFLERFTIEGVARQMASFYERVLRERS